MSTDELHSHPITPAGTGTGDNWPGRPCAAAAALAVVGERWALLAIREVFLGNNRFNDIARNTGAPRDRLAARLKDLVDAGVLERRTYQENPTRAGYHLTAAGRDLGPVLQSLLTWGERWAVDRSPAVQTHHDHPFAGTWVCATCQEPVRYGDLRLHVTEPGWTVRGPDRGEDAGA
jgi:DNA-binding HxlR family transcriptional regulator